MDCPTLDSKKLMWGLGLASGLALLSTIILPMPREIKTLTLGTACILATGNAAISWDDKKWVPHKAAIERSQQLAIEERLSAQHAYSSAVQDSIAEIQLFQWVMGQHPQFHSALLTEHDLWKYYQPIAVESADGAKAETITVQTPAGLMDQPSILAQKESGAELDTTWFKSWEARSGIICGESGDGKSKTLIYVLARFLQANQGQRCEVYIGDPDYGSSHGDAEPNNWLGLKLGQHIAVDVQDIYRMVLHVSGIVDNRANKTAKAVSDGNGKPSFDNVLFLLDEAPAVMNALDKESREDFKAAIANILRRGLKQNVTFKMGTQSLAVGSLALPQDILRQVETVVLWRAAQVKENYGNLGIQPKQVEVVVDAVSQLPRKVQDTFVCAVFVGKQLSVRGIPTIGEINVSTECVQLDRESTPTSDSGDLYVTLLDWIAYQGWTLTDLKPQQESALRAEFQKLTNKSLSDSGVKALVEYLQKL